MNNLKLINRTKNLNEITEKLSAVKDVFEIVEDECALDGYDKSKKLKERNFPYSCTEEEGYILYRAIKTFNLKNGFEIATAFGYSSLFLGLGFKENHGKLVSLDCYVEEWKDSYEYDVQELYEAAKKTKAEIASGLLPIGFKYAQLNRDRLDLHDIITYEIGISPDDLKTILQNGIDFAFIDGGHFGDQPTQDFLGVYPYLSDRCLVFFHDNNGNPHVGNAISTAESKFGTVAVNLNTKYQLSVIGRSIDRSLLIQLNNYSLRQISRPPKNAKSVLANVVKRGINKCVRIYNALKTWYVGH